MPPLDSAAAPFDPLAAAGFSQGSDGAYQPPAAGPSQQPSLVPVYGANGQWIGYQRPAGWSPPATSPEGQSGGGAATPPPAPTPANVAPTGAVPAAAPVAGAPAATIDVSGGEPPPRAFDPLAAAGFQQAPTGAYLAPGEQPPAAVAPSEQAARQLPGQEVRNTPWYRPLVENIKGAVGSLEHGMSLGLDEIVDPIIPAIVESQRTGKPFTQAYDEQVAKQRVPRTEFQAEHPAAATAITMAGQVPAMVEASPLFGTAAPAASLASKAATLGRNVAASTGVGAGTGFTMTDGDLAARAHGAGEGAAIGAALGPVGDVVTGVGRAIGSPMKTIGPLINPDAAGQRMAGQVLRETAGTPAPAMQSAPTPGVALNTPQASGNAGLASLLDTINAGDVPGMKAEQSAQNQGLLAAVPQSTAAATAGGPEPAAAAASAKAESAVRAARDVIKTEERRVWNTPALTDPNGVSSQTAKDMVEAEVRRMQREEPGLADVLHDPALMRVLKDLAHKPEKLAANQLNGISSRLRSIARDPNSPGDVKLVATRLANAVQEGIWNAPEVAGRAPVQASQAGAPPAPAQAPPSPTQTAIAAGKAPRRPETLVQFLTRKGGVQPDPDLLAAGAETYHHQAGGRLINKKGMTVHEAREAARDEGFPLGDDDHKLRTAVAEELSGRPTYRTNDASDVEFWRHADQETADQERRMANGHAAAAEAAAQAGVRLTPEAQEHAASLLAADPNMHPEEAVRQAVQEQEDRELGQNAQRSAMGQPGVPLGAHTPPLGTQQLAEGVPPNPQLVRDLKAARAFTQREHQIMGHAAFDNILRRNSQGNETGVTGTGMARFFDFANGVEKPGAISNVVKFLDDIRSEWLKLNNASGSQFDPATVAPVMQDLVVGTRDYIMSKMLSRVSGNELDMQGSRMINAAQMSKWIETNRNLLERAGVFTPSQLDALDKLGETGRMIQRGYSLGRSQGSPTFTRLQGNKYLDAFLSPLVSTLTGMGIGGTLGAVFGEGSFGILFGAEQGYLGSVLLNHLYAAPRAAALEWINKGIRDPAIATDLMRQATPKSAARFSPQTKQWLRAGLALQPAAQGARVFGVPGQPAANAQ